jgi:hypothetical protein
VQISEGNPFDPHKPPEETSMSRVAPLVLFSTVLGVVASVSMTTHAEAATIPHVGHSTQLTPGGGVIIVQNLTPGGGVIIVQN